MNSKTYLRTISNNYLLLVLTSRPHFSHKVLFCCLGYSLHDISDISSSLNLVTHRLQYVTYVNRGSFHPPGGGEKLNKTLFGDAPSRRPRHPFRVVTSIEKSYPFHNKSVKQEVFHVNERPFKKTLLLSFHILRVVISLPFVTPDA